MIAFSPPPRNIQRTCYDKQSYKRKSYARQVLGILRQRRITSRPNLHLDIYKCPYCGDFHIGHDKKHRRSKLPV